MKYEFISIPTSIKENDEDFYIDSISKHRKLNIVSILDDNPSLKFPIGIFINGVLLDSTFFSYKDNVVTFTNERYSPIIKDQIYMIMTSNGPNSGYVKQSICKELEVYDDKTLITNADGCLKFPTNKHIVAIVVNGVVYDSEKFVISYDVDLGFKQLVNGENVPLLKDKIEFLTYRPDLKDDFSILTVDTK